MDNAAIELVIEPRQRPVGTGFVDRLLPVRARRMVGPFIFADLMGPEQFAVEATSGVAVHPHIGLATVTNLFEGTMVHRDSTGAVQTIRPGDVNWMTAGSGVTHSERYPTDLVHTNIRQSGLQTWVALPDGDEDQPAAFTHVAANQVPTLIDGALTQRLIAGEYGGEQSPVPARSPLFYLDIQAAGTGTTTLPASLGERAIIPLAGTVEVNGTRIANRHLAVVASGDALITCAGDARVIALGGQPVGRRYIDWNFVASSKQRLATARARWAEYDFPLVAGDDELIPLPT